MPEATRPRARGGRFGHGAVSERVASLAARLLGRDPGRADGPPSTKPGPDFRTLVRQIYLALLGREADVAGLEYWSAVAARADSIEPVLRAIAASEEHRLLQGYRFAAQANELAIFSGYSDADLRIFAGFRNPNAKAEPGFVVDFLGGRTRVTSLWDDARKLDGRLLDLPVPADYHAEAAEWVGLLKTVQSAGARWAGMELGAGFGPWIVAGANAARLKGITDIRLCAVEADAGHFELLRRHVQDNGFAAESQRLFHAAVGVAPGTAFWPVTEDAREDWGSRPMQAHAPGTAATDHLGRTWVKTVPVQILAMSDLVEAEPRWDMVHIDVQGHEVEICRSCIEELNRRVHWLIVGTHSRKLDGDMIELMRSAGWLLENEKPSKFHFLPEAPTLEAMTHVDGVQVWRNPRMSGGDRGAATPVA